MATETVLITGCSSGIGEATARRFLEDDWRVYATARDPADIEALGAAGAETLALDVTDDEQVEAAVAAAEDGGGLDCLVNNAGYGQFGAVEDVPTEALHDQFDVNVYGPHRLIRAALPGMRAAGDGTIVNVSSVAGRVALPGSGAYCASKAALEALSDSLRAELDGTGVDVTVIEPGPVDTGFQERADAGIDGIADRSAAYAAIYEVIEDGQIVGGALGGSSPAAVARAIHNAASCAEPPARTTVGPIARLAAVSRFLPDRWRDAAFRLGRRLVV